MGQEEIGVILLLVGTVPPFAQYNVASFALHNNRKRYGLFCGNDLLPTQISFFLLPWSRQVDFINIRPITVKIELA